MRTAALFCLVLVMLICVCFFTSAQEVNKAPKSYAPALVQNPVVRERFTTEPSRTYLLNGLINLNFEYEVWVENSITSTCRPLGTLENGDTKIIFVPRQQTIRLPMPTQMKWKEVAAPPVRHSTMPVYKRNLPGGGYEVKIVSPDGQHVEIYQYRPDPKKDKP